MALKMWDEQKDFEAEERAWEKSSLAAARELPLKGLNQIPKMVGITEETAKNLRWKSLKWMVLKDHGLKILRGFLRHPVRYLKNYLQSLKASDPFIRQGDFFYYGISGKSAFDALLKEKNTLFVLGFSYCHKPLECPSGRFTDQCMQSEESLVCRQCFIGKCVHLAPKEHIKTLFIPTVHYIGEKIFELIRLHPDQKLIFLITACEMTLKMFADWGNMVGIKGVGVRLDGRICNTMKAFELSEMGIKPGLTVVLDETKIQMLEWICLRRKTESVNGSS